MYRLEVVAELRSEAHEGVGFRVGGIRIRMVEKEEEEKKKEKEKEKPKEDGFLRHEIPDLVLVMTRNSNQIVEREWYDYPSGLMKDTEVSPLMRNEYEEVAELCVLRFVELPLQALALGMSSSGWAWVLQWIPWVLDKS